MKLRIYRLLAQKFADSMGYEGQKRYDQMWNYVMCSL